MSNRLTEILDIVSASGEESDSLLADLLKPEDMTREQAQEVFEEAIGYDPTTYFDKKDIKQCVDDLIEDKSIPEEVSSSISKDKDEIVDVAFQIFDESREAHVSDAVSEAVHESLGFDLYSSDNDEDEYEEDDDYDDED